MKLFILIILFQSIVLYSASGQSQTGTDSTGVSVRTPSEKRSHVVEKKEEHKSERAKQKTVQSPEAPLKGFIDENGDGIDDRRQTAKGKGQGHMGQMQHDRFIDNDGDGINDERCGGMGIAPKKNGGCSDGRHH